MAEVSLEQTEASYRWLLGFLESADRLDPEPYVKTYFTPNAVLNFGKKERSVGYEAIFEDFQSMHNLESMKHTVLKETVVVTPDRILQECTIDYVVKGDPLKKVIRVRGFGVHWKAPGETAMHRFDVFGDFSDLGERVKLVRSLMQ